MADLSELQSSQSVKIVGAGSTGAESYFADVTSERRLQTQGPAAGTALNSRVSVSNASSQLLAADSTRKMAIITNNSGATIWLKLGAAAVVNEGFQLASGATYEINSTNLWTGTINAIKSGGNVNIDVFQGST